MTRKLIVAAAAAVFAITGMTAAAAATPPRAMPAIPAHRDCVTVTFGWQTQTGHEANAPVTVCGAGLRHGLQCELNTQNLAPGTVAECAAVPRG